MNLTQLSSGESPDLQFQNRWLHKEVLELPRGTGAAGQRVPLAPLFQVPGLQAQLRADVFQKCWLTSRPRSLAAPAGDPEVAPDSWLQPGLALATVSTESELQLQDLSLHPLPSLLHAVFEETVNIEQTCAFLLLQGTHLHYSLVSVPMAPVFLEMNKGRNPRTLPSIADHLVGHC